MQFNHKNGQLTQCSAVDGQTCPRVRIKCEIEERNECTRHRHCPNKKRCCMFSCGKKCLDLKQDVCSLPQDPGPCMAYFPRWWYNKETEVCTEFIYGGCKGNPNNFQTEHICRVVCKKKSVHICSQPSVCRCSHLFTALCIKMFTSVHTSMYAVIHKWKCIRELGQFGNRVIQAN
ncbi:WAP four-disulfide core domain protein 6A [Microtus ochrogaster]|uniref:WAP four-disulfide core domain protein 6A n=1 Tax=Microtus ochrogaster TaxID=79684 RepID=A0ABM1UM64_MICOH|nr:WAP four-disulfide core domain protein 6A [Microtus ochrogaster]